MVAAILQEAGWRVGLYTSPHLFHFQERIRVDGIDISDSEAVFMFLFGLKSYYKKFNHQCLC